MEHPIDSLSAYVDDELTAEERRFVETHLAECKPCSSMVNELAETKQQIAGIFGALDLPPNWEQSVIQVIEQKSQARAWLRSWSIVSAAGLIGAAAVWFVFGSALWKGFSVLYKLLVAVMYLFSNLVTAIPTLFAAVLILAFLLFAISGITLRRLLRSSTP